jgi:hypothetical protein
MKKGKFIGKIASDFVGNLEHRGGKKLSQHGTEFFHKIQETSQASQSRLSRQERLTSGRKTARTWIRARAGRKAWETRKAQAAQGSTGSN